MSSHLQLGAIDTETNKYTLPSDAIKCKKYKCIECNKKVILRKGEVRKPHYAHYAQTNTCHYYDHPNEAQIHKDAKMLMAQLLKDKKEILFTWDCKICGEFEAFDNDDSTILYKEEDEIITEYRSKDGKWVADVALINNGEVRYIVEIKNTHSTTTERPEPWFEVKAKELIEIVNETNEAMNKDNEEERKVNPNHIDWEFSYRVPCIRNIDRYCYSSFCGKEQWIRKIPEYDETLKDNSCILCKKESPYEYCYYRARYDWLDDNNKKMRVCYDCLLRDSYEKKLREIYSFKEKQSNKSIGKWDFLSYIPLLGKLDGGMCHIRKHDKPCISCNNIEYQPVYEYKRYYSICTTCFNDLEAKSRLVKKLNIVPRNTQILTFNFTDENPKELPISENELLSNVPTLMARAGASQMWNQESSCVSCGRGQYSPVYENKKYYSICKICLADSQTRIDTLKKIKEKNISTEPKCMIKFC
jgi:hypothetical protein